MGIVVIGAVFVDIKGYPEAGFIPTGRNAGRVEQIHGGVGAVTTSVLMKHVVEAAEKA